MTSIFAQAVASIETEYERLGHTLGWRFLSTSSKTLDNPEFAFITLNPGGNKLETDHGTASCEEGCGYLVEEWKGNKPGQAKLQRQIQELFKMLGEEVDRDGTELLESTLCAHLVPFRSPSLKDLPKQKESLAFGYKLWHDIFKEISPRYLITIAREVSDALRKVMRTGSPISHQYMPTGWGTYTADIWHFKDRSMLRLPHLSRFSLFESKEREPYLSDIVHELIRGGSR